MLAPEKLESRLILRFWTQNNYNSAFVERKEILEVRWDIFFKKYN